MGSGGQCRSPSHRILTVGLLALVLVAGLVGPPCAVASKEEASREGKTIQGAVVEVTGDDTVPVHRAVVLVAGVDSGTATRWNPPPVMDQVQLVFEPHVLPAWVGQTLTFRNSDAQVHNVRLNDRDEGTLRMNRLTPPGDRVIHTLRSPGIVRVRCDIHPSMEAFLVVRSEPFLWASTDSRGRFRLRVPDTFVGKRVIEVWSERRGFRSLERTFPPKPSTSVTIRFGSDQKTQKEGKQNEDTDSRAP